MTPVSAFGYFNVGRKEKKKKKMLNGIIIPQLRKHQSCCKGEFASYFLDLFIYLFFSVENRIQGYNLSHSKLLITI